MLTLDQLGISEQDWNHTPASVRAALMFLLQQNQRMENRCATYELQVKRLEAEVILENGSICLAPDSS